MARMLKGKHTYSGGQWPAFRFGLVNLGEQSGQGGVARRCDGFQGGPKGGLQRERCSVSGKHEGALFQMLGHARSFGARDADCHWNLGRK